MRDVATVLQRAEMVRRIAEEIEGYVDRARRRRPARPAPARGADRRRRGRPAARRQGLLRAPRADWELADVMARARRRSTTRRCSTSTRSPRCCTCRPTSTLDTAVQPRGFRLLHKIPRLPELVSDHVVERFANLQKIMRASVADLVEVEGVGDARARAIKDGLARLAETSASSSGTRRSAAELATDMAELRRDRTTSTSSASRCRAPTARRSRPSTRAPTACRSRASCCTPTSWACARCSTTCAAGSRRTASRCARPSRSPARRRRARRRRPDGAHGARAASSTTTSSSATSRRAADYLVVHDDVRDVFVLGLLHGRDADAQGRGDGRVRPRRRVLRDDPRARGLARPAARASRSTPRPRCARRSRSSAAPTRCTPAGRHRRAPRARGRDRPDCEIVVYPEADHGFVHAPERPAHRRRRRRRRLAANARLPCFLEGNVSWV